VCREAPASTEISNSLGPASALVQFRKALLKHFERRRAFHMNRGKVFSYRLQQDIKRHAVDAPAACAITDMLSRSNQALNGLLLEEVVRHTAQCTPSSDWRVNAGGLRGARIRLWERSQPADRERCGGGPHSCGAAIPAWMVASGRGAIRSPQTNDAGIPETSNVSRSACDCTASAALACWRNKPETSARHR